MFSEQFWGEVLKLIVPTLAGIAGIIVALRTHHTVEIERARKKKQRRTDWADDDDRPKPYDEFQSLEQLARDKKTIRGPGRDL